MNKKHHYIGLTDEQVAESRRQHGQNILTPPEKEPLWQLFLKKFGDPLIIILMIAGALSIGISCYEYFGLGQGLGVFFEPVGIFVAILLATGLAFYFEVKADKEFTLLNQTNDDERVEVVRNATATEVARRDVVVGDICILHAGDEVAADGELLESTLLNVDESSLTGEPFCMKTTDEQLFDPSATYPSNHVMKGTKVMEGHALCRVLAVGDLTEQGKVYVAAQIDNSVKTPLAEQLDSLGGMIAKVSYAFAAAVVVGRLLMFFLLNDFELFSFIAYLLQTVMIAVTLIVVSVPEGLPMAVTMSLAYSMRRMLKTNNLVRKMHACETMGAATVICTDKTGTLTQNQMSIYNICLYGVTGPTPDIGDLEREGWAVNSTASLDFTDEHHPRVVGNPTEGALLLWLNQHDTDYRDIRESCRVVEELPFSTERKYMATVVESAVLPGKRVLYVKGAPEIVLSLCRNIRGNEIADKVASDMKYYQSLAMRTLGFAYQILNPGETIAVADHLQFTSMVAIEDPVRKEVPQSVKECLDAGIKVKIVTGDNSGTAREIARQIGLWDTDADSDRNIINGPEFAQLSDHELKERVADLKILSRARPMDKKRLVELLQQSGEVVAVTGDGTNDAPALKSAHVGLSMGDGTSVAKEASDITIIDNSFGSIGKAVMWGRSLYRNIQRFLLFQLTVNVTASFLVLTGAFTGTESPLTVTQMLWINLIMDTFAAMALASLPPSERVMREKPRSRTASILSKAMCGEILGVGGFFFVMLLAILLVFKHSDVSQLTDLLSLPYGQIFSNVGSLAFWTSGHLSSYELTLLFTIFVMTHFFYLFNARAFETGKSALHLKDCEWLVFIAAIIFLGQVAMVEVPGMQQFFNVESLKLTDWIIIIVGSSLVLWIRELWYLTQYLMGKTR